MSELSTVSVTDLKGVGAALAEKLAKVGLETLRTSCSTCRCATRTAPV